MLQKGKILLVSIKKNKTKQESFRKQEKFQNLKLQQCLGSGGAGQATVQFQVKHRRLKDNANKEIPH